MRAVADRVARLEEIMGEPGEVTVGDLASQVADLVDKMTEMQASQAQLLMAHTELVRDLEERHAQQQRSDLAMMERLEGRARALEEEVVQLKQTSRGTPSISEAPGPRAKVPEPKPFGGSRSAKEVENFIWDLEVYFRAARIPGADQVDRASMFLEGDAKLWWRTRTAEDTIAGRPKIEVWESFKKELREQFLPCNTSWIARENLRKLRQTGSIREYVKEFSTLLLDVSNMTEEDKLFNFLSGLQPWAQAELRRKGVKDIPSAIAAAEALVDFRGSITGEHAKGNGKGREASPPKTRGAKKKKFPQRFPQRKAANQKAVVPMGGAQRQPQRPRWGCFICGGRHIARDCPKREVVSAIITREASGSGHAEAGPSQVSPLQLLNTISAENIPQRARSLMHMQVRVNGKESRAMLDTGATNNFIARREAERLGLQIGPSSRTMKAVNSGVSAVHGVAEAIVELGAWSGKCPLMVVELDDFDFILGMDFFMDAKAILFPYRRGIMVGDVDSSCFVRAVEVSPMVDKGKAVMVSAKQMDKGLRRGQPTYLAAMVEVQEDPSMVPDQVEEVLREFKDIMPEQLPKALPPQRAIDHRIELEPGTRPPARVPYRMSPFELAELRKQLDELLEAGLIQPSKAPYGAPVLFQKKADGSLRMCVDYRALNKVTIKNKYPIPNASDLFDRLSSAAVFSKLDLRSGYWQVRIAEGDESKTTCVTRYGSFEFKVMPFGLTNAPATFCNLMNDVLYAFLDRFVVVYLDDIVIYSNTMEEHMSHLKEVLETLRKHKLCIKKEKCTFAAEEIKFLGHWISKGRIRMDQDKVKAIVEWPVPGRIPDLRAFLGLANYYRRFIVGYSRRARALTDMLKKERSWEWTPECQAAFEDLKEAMAAEPVLALPDFSKAFEVVTDASNWAIGGVLMQEGHPVAYESRKLKDAEVRYTAHEKEMTAVIHCLERWRHYLLGTKFTVVTDNVANTYFSTQRKLTPKQARWQEYLAEFDFSWQHRPGRLNQVADALSRREAQVYAAALTTLQGNLVQRVREQASTDAAYVKLLKEIEAGESRRYWCEDGLIYALGRRLYIPSGGELRREIIREIHDSQWAGHPGEERMIALLRRSYYWPKMREEVEFHVRTCTVCQLDKTERRKQAGLLQPLPVPEKPWASVSMDFITGLPEVQGMKSILVVVDRFSKYAIFIPAPQPCSAETAANLFFRNIVKVFGLPSDIVSDRDARFTGKFWTTVFQLMGSELKFSTANHPQTDGQTERINALLEEFLRHFVTASQRNWLDLLDTAQYSYNLHRSSSTGHSPAELCLGFQPMNPLEVAQRKEQGECPAAYRWARDKTELLEAAQESLEKARRRMKKYADRNRRSREFQVGDKVLLKLTPQIWKKLTDRRYHKALVQRYDGPFVVTERIGNVAYRLALPDRLKIHPSFHVSFLKPFYEDEDPGRKQPRRAPPLIRVEFTKKIYRVLDHRTVGESKLNRRTDFLIHWEGEDESEATWERGSTLWQFEDLIMDYLRHQSTRASTSGAAGGMSPTQR